MKLNKYLALFTVVLLGAVAFMTSCEEENDYNFNSIEPGKTAITGPALIYTGEPYTFKALTRGGSTYTWTKVSGNFEITPDGYQCTVISNADANDVGVLTVTETTQGGKTGIADTITFDISLFCTFDINTFIGAYTCDETGYGPYPVNLTQDPDNAMAVLNDNFWDYAGEGEVVSYEFSGDFDQIVTVPLQDFVYGGGETGNVEGEGTYNGCTGEFYVLYTNEYDGDVYETEHNFTPGAPAAKSVKYKKGR